MSDKHLPGRLGDDSRTLLTDSRTDPRIAAALAQAGQLGDLLETPPPHASYEERLAFTAAFEAASAAAHPMMEAAMPAFAGVETRTVTIKGVDDNDIPLYISEPVNAEGPRPGILHIHGGGMVLMKAADPMFLRWRNTLAEAGLTVVGVEFRNGGGELGNHPYPAGLNDCASALQWMHANQAELGISGIVLSGESGGGNLTLATTLKAKRDGYLDAISGAYAMCPYICGQYADPPAELLSLRENDGYSMDCALMAALVGVYDPTGEAATDPLAWPYHASTEDLRGLPPHVISVNELDPLRDEGLAYYLKLVAAGNSAVARTVNGTHHAGDVGVPDVVPDIYADTLASLCAFAHRVTG